MFVRLDDKEKGKKRFYVIAGMSFDTDNLTVTVQCKSLAYTLSDIPIKGFTTIDNVHPDGLDYSSWTPSEIIRATVDRDEDTPWSLGDVDVDLDLKRREFTFDGSLGELVNSVAEKFGAVIEYDDENYKINLRDPEKVGRNRGLKMSERNYLKSLTKDTNADSMVTQLALYGKDGLTIHDISPTGSPYIEDFSHFLYPYEEDEQGNIIKSSYFMSDSLAKAMVTYNKKIEGLSPAFDDYLLQLDDKMQQVSENENLKADLNIQLAQIQEQIDIHLALNNGESNAEYETNKSQILTSISALETVISGLKADISALAGVNYYDSGFVPTGSEGGQIGLLKEQMLVRNNFTPSQIAERSHFIIRKEWTNDSIIDSKDLLEEGKKQLKEMIKPNISMTLGLLNFLSIVDAPKVVSEFHMFDTIRIEEAWNKRTSEVKIVGFSINYDTKDLNVTVANVKDNNDGTNKFLQMLYQSSFAATVVNENKYKWDLSKENNGQINALINQNFDAIKKKVTGGVAGLTEFSSRGVISRDYEDQNKYLVLQNGVMATTNNGGVTWGHAITPTGIVGERIYGKIIAGMNLTIEDKDGIFRILGNKASISNRFGEEVVKLGLVTEEGEDERFGLIVDNRKNQVGIVDGEGFYISRYSGANLEKLLWTDSSGNLNAQKITATDMAIVNGDMRSAVVRNSQGIPVISFDSTYGIKIRNKTNTGDVFWIDTNGRLNVNDIVINSGSISWGGVNNQPIPDVSWSSLQGKPTYLNQDYIWSPNIYGGMIQGGSFINDNLTITDSQLSTYKQTALGKVSSILDYGSLRMKADYNYFETPTTRDFSISYEINGSGGNNNADVFIRSGQSSMQILSNANIIIGANSIQFPSYGSLLWGSETVATRTWVTNTIANTYSFATESWVSNNFASKYHSHSEYIASGSQPTFSGVVSSSYKSSGNYNNIWSGSLGVTRILDSGGGQWGTLWGIVENKSSINYKTNLDKFDNIGIDALKLIEETQIWKFHYQSQIDQGYFDKPKVGVIAEMVHPIIRANDGVDSYSMVSVAWKAIQQLSKQVSELQEKVKLLEEIQ
ncbi:hypothetical protein C0431_15385 [bacterium]|nr:hypothetical protein [bacterium]